MQTPDLKQRLHLILADEAASKRVADVARALGFAERTFRRRLRNAGTSFQKELKDARLRMAKHKLVTTDLKVSTLAYQIGYASPQHFSTMFHQATGETPSAFRARARVQAVDNAVLVEPAESVG